MYLFNIITAPASLTVSALILPIFISFNSGNYLLSFTVAGLAVPKFIQVHTHTLTHTIIILPLHDEYALVVVGCWDT